MFVKFECDQCGRSVDCSGNRSSAKEFFLASGFIQVNGRWYCDGKCRDNHKVELKLKRQG